MINLYVLILSLFYRPSFEEFVISDKTNEIPYSQKFDCKEYTKTFIQNISPYYKAYPVGVGFYSNETLVFHQFVAVEVDGQTIWFEPQTDKTYVIAEAGESLCYQTGGCFGKLAFVFIETSP